MAPFRTEEIILSVISLIRRYGRSHFYAISVRNVTTVVLLLFFSFFRVLLFLLFVIVEGFTYRGRN